MEQKLNSMRDQITRMQADQDRLEERLGAIELQKMATVPRRGPVVADASMERPRLKVIKLAPDGQGAGTEAEELPEEAADPAPGTAARPVIRARGNKVDGAPAGDGDSGQNAGADSGRRSSKRQAQ